MPLIVFSYTKPVETVGNDNFNSVIALTTTLDFIPRVSNWALVNFNWQSIQLNSANLGTLSTSCIVYPEFLAQQTHLKTSSTDVVITKTSTDPDVFSYTTQQTDARIPAIKKNGTPSVRTLGAVNYHCVEDSGSFNPLPFGTVDIISPVLRISFEGRNMFNQVSTSSITSFDAVFHYD
jgi:hypothetical protein